MRLKKHKQILHAVILLTFLRNVTLHLTPLWGYMSAKDKSDTNPNKSWKSWNLSDTRLDSVTWNLFEETPINLHLLI